MSDHFSDKIRSAIAAGPVSRERLAKPDLAKARFFDERMPVEELRKLFQERATQSASTVHQPRSFDEVVETICGIIPAGSVIVLDFTVGCAGQLAGKLGDRYKIHRLDQADDETLFGATAAITSVDLAVAETGSVILTSGARRPRLASLVAEIHVAMIRTDEIVSDLVDVDAALKKRFGTAVPGGITLISGPSKTADIEMNLVIGVHGPGQMHMVLLP